MSASSNKPRYLLVPILFGAIACAFSLYAQQTAETDEQQPQEPSENRRIERLGEVSADEWEMNLVLPGNDVAESSRIDGELALPDETQNQTLQGLLTRLAENPGNTSVLRQLNELLLLSLTSANELMDSGDFQRAEQILQVIQSVDPGLKGLSAARGHMQSVGVIAGLLQAADEALEGGRVLQPENDNAQYYFRKALEREPDNETGLAGLDAVREALLERALGAAQTFDFEAADNLIRQVSEIDPEQTGLAQTNTAIEGIKQQHAVELEQQAVSAMNSGHFSQADMSIIDLMALGGQQQRIDNLRLQLAEARLYGGLKPGQVIRDELQLAGGKAPELVIIPAGSFRMGSRGHSEHEEPRHRVTIAMGFALGLKEVTVEEFRLFINSTAYRTTAEKNGYSSIYNETAGLLIKRDDINWKHGYRGRKARPEMPVLHISLNDASTYAQWLSTETGKKYRLPSEAEYEYVATAGGKSSYWWGEGSPPAVVENLTGERDKSPSGRQWTVFFSKYGDEHWGPAPAGVVSDGELAHPLGVFDIIGNVSEWVEDCWHDNYVKAPVDGSAWVNPGCTRRVARGGYWASAPEQSRAAARLPVKTDQYGPVIGFRVARDL